jgi:hypothetical protein
MAPTRFIFLVFVLVVMTTSPTAAGIAVSLSGLPHFLTL